jgi:hypothetical protein
VNERLMMHVETSMLELETHANVRLVAETPHAVFAYHARQMSLKLLWNRTDCFLPVLY